MGFNSNPEQHVEHQQSQMGSKTALDPAEYWARPTDSSFASKTAVSLPDSLTMTSPYANLEQTGSSQMDFSSRLLHPAESNRPGSAVGESISVEPLSFRPIIDNEPREQLVQPQDFINPAEAMTPRQLADRRDADAIMDAIRTASIDDLKSLISDMSPEKLKRVAEQMKAEGFEISAGKDGKFVLFNKDLGLGISIQSGKDGEPAKAEVVKKDGAGNYVSSTDGLDPAKVLKNFSAQIPASQKEIEDIIKEMEKNHQKDPERFQPKRDPWERLLVETDAERKAREEMLKGLGGLDR